ncbi:VanZ family protein [Quatrionicoccus australiensis]|uniref:VanZ family protein n=1 Tax=Quatrionicoccus australiensis TaxID=138118 RepID=UPI001CF7EFE9|nr:VanZ family protein [Quatrionicoccus australiensis]UCV13943.1 VanZ family protein [Quatrionicoccus australiensis]
MKLPFRLVPLFVSAMVVLCLYWGLNQAESRAIYASWDKVLHASVFFVIWWITRWSLRGSWLWITLIAVVGGGAEEIHQFFQEGHVPSLEDWYADIVGVSLAAVIYLLGRLLWLLRASVGEREALVVLERREVSGWRKHALDWRWTFKVWRWGFYLVMLGGRERRALGPAEQTIARWSVWALILGFLLVSTATVLVVLLLIQTALGWQFPSVLDWMVRGQ